MRRLVICVAAAAAILAVLPPLLRGDKRVSDTTKSVSVVVPQGWKKSDKELMGTKLILLGPNRDGFRTNVNLYPEPVGSSMTLAAYERITLRNAAKMLSGYKLVSRGDTRLGGMPAKRWVYCSGIGAQRTKLKHKAVYTIKKKAAYVLTYTSLERHYDKDVGAFDSTVKSLKWLK